MDTDPPDLNELVATSMPDPDENFVVIMTDGKVYKSTLEQEVPEAN